MLNPSAPHCAPTDFGRAHSTVWLAILALVCGLLFPVLLMRGMFLDGVVYATVSRNMAVGIGDLWHPAFSATLPLFCDAPPLAYLLQSWFFRIFGDHWWVERLYSVTTAVPTGVAIVLIWRRLVRHSDQLLGFSWLPVALWVLMTNWSWIYRHNLLENTMGIFTTLAVYGSLRAMENTRWWAAWSAAAALAISAAILSKGPVGLFPMVAPTLIWLTIRPQGFRKTLLVQASLVIFLLAAIAILLSQPAPREFLWTYFNQQVVSSLQGHREVVDSRLGRFHLLWLLPWDLLIPSVLASLCVLRARKQAAVAPSRALRGPTMFCLLTALSASLPIMISPKQGAFYTAPSWPFYTMTLAFWCLPSVAELTTRWIHWVTFPRSNWVLRTAAISTIGLIVAASPFWFGRTWRDRDVIVDVDRISQIVSPQSTVTISPELRQAWGLQAYLYRWHYISVQESGNEAYQLEFADQGRTAPAGCTLVDAHLKVFRLYQPSATAVLQTSAQLR